MTKEMKYGEYTFKHGDRFFAYIRGKYVEGRISLIGSNPPYLCQDKIAGNPADDKLGYKYSWSIRNGLSINEVTEFKHLPADDDYEVW